MEVLDSLRAEAVAGLNRLRHGGVEVGGVLFGLREAGEIRIVKSRAFQSEHARGPGFILSEKDDVELERMIQEAAADPELRGLQAVGWYCSHTRSALCLLPHDIDLYNRHFPQPWQIALVLCPTPLGPAEAGLFFRETSGTLRSEPPQETFTLFPPQRKPTAVQSAEVPAALAAGPSPEFATSRPPDTISQLASSPPSSAISRPPHSGIGWLFASLFLGAFAVSVVTGVLSTPRPAAAKRPSLDLRAIDHDGAVNIGWNRDADFVLASQKAFLAIVDGGERSETQLSPQLLRNGRLVYYRKSRDVEIRMILHREQGDTVQELMRLVGLSPIPSRAASVPGVGPPSALHSATNTTIRRPLHTPTAESRESSIYRAEAKKARSIAPVEALTSGRFQEVESNRGVSAAPSRAPTIAPVLSAGEEAARSEAQPPTRYRGPTSGRLIWTGAMGAHSTVRIEGNRASRGDLTGELPEVPIQISAYPASLSRGAMNVYASHLSGEKQTSELPGPGNGWLRTVYKRDEKRAADLKVEEFPSAQNNWTKIILRSGNRDISAIVIDWQVSR